MVLVEDDVVWYLPQELVFKSCFWRGVKFEAFVCLCLSLSETFLVSLDWLLSMFINDNLLNEFSFGFDVLLLLGKSCFCKLNLFRDKLALALFNNCEKGRRITFFEDDLTQTVMPSLEICSKRDQLIERCILIELQILQAPEGIAKLSSYLRQYKLLKILSCYGQ